MDRLIYTAASSARALMQRQDGIANNLANANTPGFRADQVAFRAVPLLGEGTPTRVGSVEVTAGFDDTPGAIERTGRALDVAIGGRGYFAVQAPDGEAYSRAGGFEVTPDGTLTGAAGLPVLGEGGPITIPAGSQVTIAGDGTITAQGPTGAPQNIGRLKLVNPPAGEMQKGADGLLRTKSGEPAAADADVRVTSGAIEGSNVNVVDAMVQMISSARQFETQMKLLQSADQNDQRAAQLLGPSR